MYLKNVSLPLPKKKNFLLFSSMSLQFKTKIITDKQPMITYI